MKINSLHNAQHAANKGSISSVVSAMSGIQKVPEYGNSFLTAGMIATEGFGEHKGLVQTTQTTLRADIIRALEKAGYAFEDYQVDAGVTAGLLGADLKGFFESSMSPVGQYDKFIAAESALAGNDRQFSVESYNEEDTRNLQMCSIIYNIMSSGQDKFGELFFPLITIDATTPGIEITLHLSMVYNDYVRSTSGITVDHGRKQTLRAFVNPEVLENRTTEVIPVLRPVGAGSNADKFVDVSLVPSHDEKIGVGITVPTAPLKCGVEFDLSGISQRNEILNAGLMDHTDTLSHAIKLRSIIVQFGQDVFELPTAHLEGSSFVAAQQGDTRNMSLIFQNNSITIPRGKQTVLGADPIDPANFSEYEVRFGVNLNGTISLDTGTTEINGSKARSGMVRDLDGNLLAGTDLKKVTDFVDTGVVLGYRLEAFFENLNLRVNGQLVEAKSYRIVAQVPYLSPISAVASTYRGQEGVDASLAELISLTNIRANNSGVDKLEEMANVISNYLPIPDKNGDIPGLNMAGSYYVIPKWSKDKVSATDIVANLRSAHAFEDIKHGILNRLHRMIMELIIDSEYIPAGLKLTGDNKFKPHAVVVTDPLIASYLTTKFETTEFEHAEYKLTITSVLNKRMRGKLYVSFNNCAPGAQTVDPLTCGHQIQSTELVSVLAKSFNNQTSRVITVTPRLLFLPVLPVMGFMEITDLPDISKKIPLEVNTHAGLPVPPKP